MRFSSKNLEGSRKRVASKHAEITCLASKSERARDDRVVDARLAHTSTNIALELQTIKSLQFCSIPGLVTRGVVNEKSEQDAA